MICPYILYLAIYKYLSIHGIYEYGEREREIFWTVTAGGRCSSGLRTVKNMKNHQCFVLSDGFMLSSTLVCLTRLRLSKKPGDQKAKKSKQVSQKYTASRLHEKGVLIAIEDLQPNQWVTVVLLSSRALQINPRQLQNRRASVDPSSVCIVTPFSTSTNPLFTHLLP